jgi:hypothetical protein
VRGNRYLINAVDEQWHLRKLKDEEREALRERGTNPASVRMIQIKKSRAGREGDLLKVSRDENFAYSVDDYTPTVRMEDDGQGDADPFTQVLDIVKQGCKAQEGEERARVGLTREEVWRKLLGLMQGARGDRARVPSQKTVGRWLDRWVEDGLMVSERVPNTKGRAFLIYRTSRALSLKSCPLSEPLPEFFQRNGSSSDNTEAEEQVVRTEEVVTEGGRCFGCRFGHAKICPNYEPSGRQRFRGSSDNGHPHRHYTRARARGAGGCDALLGGRGLPGWLVSLPGGLEVLDVG